jgi:leader peptidase (prepilin peptidase)/N-methyltransferase
LRPAVESIMAREGRELRRVDVGEGIFVSVPADGPASPAQVRPSTRVPALALAVGAVLSGAAIVRFGVTAEGLLAAGLLPVLAALAAIDIRARVLPNRIIGPALLAVLAWQVVFFADRVPECLVGAVGAGAFLLLPSLVQPGAVGMGDVKLAALLGLTFGADVVAALLIGFLAAAPVAGTILLLRGADARRAALPFGPFLALGAGVLLLA